MGTYNREERDANYRFQKILTTWIACLASFSIGMVGGLVLAWWELRHHPTNSQLWMVPFGLILLVTPVIIWFSVFLSYICNCSSSDGLEPHCEAHFSSLKQSVILDQKENLAPQL